SLRSLSVLARPIGPFRVQLHCEGDKTAIQGLIAHVYKEMSRFYSGTNRAINQREPHWEKTLTGYPKELYDFWEKHLKPRGYKTAFEIVDWPGGLPGEIGITLRWK